MKSLLAFTCALLTGLPHAWASDNAPIQGVGSSFAAGAYTSWAFAYAKEKNIQIVYQATSSGDGIRQIQSRAVDFGASDIPLTSDELKKNDLIQFPTLVGGVVPVVNLPGVAAGSLKLTGPLLAAIYSGRIGSWNDREIQAVNPGLALPAIPIRRLARAEASGTTAGFTEYLSKSNSDWSKKIGAGLQVSWPKGVDTAKGNDGIVSSLQSTPGTIAYVPAFVAAQSRLSYALLQNASKNFVAPTDEALTAAVRSTVVGKDQDRISYIDAPGSSAWPITDATYIIVPRRPAKPEQTAKVLRFFYWSFLRGDGMASETGYVPLPATVQARSVASFRQIQDPQNNPLNFMSRVSPLQPAQASVGMRRRTA